MAKRLKRRVVQICQAAHKLADAMLEIAGRAKRLKCQRQKIPMLSTVRTGYG